MLKHESGASIRAIFAPEVAAFQRPTPRSVPEGHEAAVLPGEVAGEDEVRPLCLARRAALIRVIGGTTFSFSGLCLASHLADERHDFLNKKLWQATTSVELCCVSFGDCGLVNIKITTPENVHWFPLGCAWSVALLEPTDAARHGHGYSDMSAGALLLRWRASAACLLKILLQWLAASQSDVVVIPARVILAVTITPPLRPCVVVMELCPLCICPVFLFFFCCFWCRAGYSASRMMSRPRLGFRSFSLAGLGLLLGGGSLVLRFLVLSLLGVAGLFLFAGPSFNDVVGRHHPPCFAGVPFVLCQEEHFLRYHQRSLRFFLLLEGDLQ
eukprot:s3077_g3.t1